MSEEQRDNIKITPEESAAFTAIMACKAACDAVVQSAIREWETVYIAERELWNRLMGKYRMDIGVHNYVLSSDNTEIRIEDKAHTIQRQARRAKRYVDEILRTRPPVDDE